MTLKYSMIKNVFCQEDTDQGLHDVMQESRDLELKTAFQESPLELQKFKIRSLSAFDAMAGELKYHLPCWNKHIPKRQPTGITQTLDQSMELRSPEPANSSFNTTIESVDCFDIDQENTEKANDDIDTRIQDMVIAELMCGVELSLKNQQVLTVRNLVEIYQSHVKHVLIFVAVVSAVRILMAQCLKM